MKIRRILVAGALATSMSPLLAGHAGATNIGNEGCTPGYWKNHTDSWEEYTPGTTLGSVFTFPASLSAMGNDTMLTALSYPGGTGTAGGARILMRASVAAFLNSAHEGVGYPLRRFSTPGEMLNAVNAALASQDRATMLELATYLDGLNNLGCPLN